MYENFYGLKEKPFQIVPNPEYLYMSPIHENALTYLEYGLMENVGFILLTGEVGTGKTTLVRHIMNQFESEKEIAVIFNTNVSGDELVRMILQSFELDLSPEGKTANIDVLYQFLIDRYARKKPVLLIIDEAQNLSDEAIEEIRMLSNLQGDDQNLIQIMLVGQPELKSRLQQPGHGAFAQRIAVNFFLSGLTEKETEAYIFHRLEKAGGRPGIFSPEAVQLIFRTSRGIPRTINLLCDTALVYGFGYELETIDTAVLEQVIKDRGGMGLAVETGNEMDAPSPGYETVHEKHADRLQRVEDALLLMKQQVEYSTRETARFDEELRGFRENLEHTLKDLLENERNRNEQLVSAYSRLKEKYDNLMKLWKWKKEMSNPNGSDIILLKQEVRGKD